MVLKNENQDLLLKLKNFENILQNQTCVFWNDKVVIEQECQASNCMFSWTKCWTHYKNISNKMVDKGTETDRNDELFQQRKDLLTFLKRNKGKMVLMSPNIIFMLWKLSISNDPNSKELECLMEEMNLNPNENPHSKINFTYLKKQYCTQDSQQHETNESVYESYSSKSTLNKNL